MSTYISDSVPPSRINAHRQPKSKSSPSPAPSAPTTSVQAIMSRKRNESTSSGSSASSSSSNNSAHHGRKALEAIQRIYALRQGRCVANAFPQTGQSSESSRSGISSGTAQHDHPPTRSESNLSQYSTESEDTITRPALINSLDRPHLFSDTPPGFQQDAERRPLLPLISPQVSPLVTSFLSPRLNQPPEPFPSLSPDIEPGFAPSDSSYEGLDVFGGHRPRRRWDLGLRSARGGGEQLWESRTFEQLHACSLVYFFIMFVVIVVGGGMLLVWGLLHQEGQCSGEGTG